MKVHVARLAPLAGAAVLLAALGSPAGAADSAESARIQELERKLERSMQMIEQLSSKVKQLEQNSAGGGAAGGAQHDARIEELQKQVGDLTAASSRRVDSGLPVHGFLDVGVGKSGEDNPIFGRGKKGFAVGAFDLYLTPVVTGNVKTLVELNFEVGEDGETATDLERAQIGYTFNDSLTAWVGRFHTPYGYWNTAFHHGPQIQTAVSRPRFLDFEDKGGILPAHTTGAWFTGIVPAGGGKLGYDAYVGNAPRIRTEASKIDSTTGLSALAGQFPGSTVKPFAEGSAGTGALNMEMAGLSKFMPSVGFKLSYQPAQLSDLTVGLHGVHAKVEDDADTLAIGATNNLTRVNVVGGYGVFNNDAWEVMAEYYRFRNRDLSGSTGTHSSSAWYAQAGYNVGVWTPFVRYEKASLDQTDNYFAVQESGRSYRRAVAGLRYDVDPKTALKFELDRNRKDDLGPGLRDNFTEARFQYAIRF